jgi:hypothetical protein
MSSATKTTQKNRKNGGRKFWASINKGVAALSPHTADQHYTRNRTHADAPTVDRLSNSYVHTTINPRVRPAHPPTYAPTHVASSSSSSSRAFQDVFERKIHPLVRVALALLAWVHRLEQLRVIVVQLHTHWQANVFLRRARRARTRTWEARRVTIVSEVRAALQQWRQGGTNHPSRGTQHAAPVASTNRRRQACPGPIRGR